MADSIWRRKPLICVPRKKENTGGVVYESSYAMRIPTAYCNISMNAKLLPCMIVLNPYYYGNEIGSKKLWNARPGTSYSNEIVILTASSSRDLPTTASTIQWCPVVHSALWSLPYCWYIRSSDTNIYKIMDSTSSYPYQVGTVYNTSTDSDGNPYNHFTSNEDITTIQDALEAAGLYARGLLLMCDHQLTDEEIIDYHAVVLTNYTGTKTAVVDFDISLY